MRGLNGHVGDVSVDLGSLFLPDGSFVGSLYTRA